MNIITRVGTPADLPNVAHFWSEHSGWGEMDLAAWEKTFGSTPQGPAQLILAEMEDTREMVGQFLFLPVPVSVQGKDLVAFRPFAPIVKSDLRGRDDAVSLQGVMLQMYLFAVEHLQQQGAELLYILPDPRWARIFSFAPFFLTATFPLFSLPMSQADEMLLPGSFRVEAMKFSDSRLDELWQETRKQYTCLAVRNPAFLQWKNSHRAYQLWSVTDQDGNLWGAFVGIRKIQQKQILICDLLYSNKKNALATVLQAAVAFLAKGEKEWQTGEDPMEKIALAATPLMEPELENLGFTKDQYQFHLVVHSLNPALGEDLVGPKHWYISAND